MCFVYLPPSIESYIVDEFLCNYNRALDSLDFDQFLLLEDFNPDTIPWSSTSSITSNSLHNNMLMDFTYLHEHTQHNLIRNDKDNILDLILGNIVTTQLNVSSNPLLLVGYLPTRRDFSFLKLLTKSSICPTLPRANVL